MSDERWDRQWDVFHDALEQPAAERTAFVSAACVGDDDLEAAVQALLASHEASGDFLEEPLIISDDVLEALQPEAMIGQSVGPYTIRAVIGEGGMGVVYEACQTEPVERRVALKVIRLGMNTSEVVARFEMERQALAVMTHPNVARVFDAGATEDGRPYFVMEFVDGIPITQYCDEERLSNRERLAICRDVFGGIQHAHQKGLIHRDLKPSNVLIEHEAGQKPVVKIIDFGIAKATDQRAAEKTMFTRLGQLVGTPAYMSPEQAVPGGAGVDTRSDIYSLCVLLYELLTGSVPFESRTLLDAGYAEMQRIIREDDPPRPSTRLSLYDPGTMTDIAERRHSSSSTIRRELEGDLDWIIIKGLEKDPARRYGSVAALADDIERHLNDEPVAARPPGARYRAAKFYRRHTLGVNVAILFVIIGVGFVTSTVMQSRELARALGTAEREQAKAEQVTSFLIELLTETDPDVAQGGTVSVREALDRGAEKIADGLDEQPEIRLAILKQMATIYRQLGLYEQATAILEQAESASRSLDGQDPGAIGEMYLIIGNLHHDQGHYEQAESAYRSGLQYLRRAHGDHGDLIALLDDLGELQTDMGNYDEAAVHLSESLAMTRRLFDGDNINAANAMQSLAYNYLLAGDTAAAGPLFSEAVAMTRRLYGDRSNQLATSLNFYAIHQRRTGNFDEAIAALEESLSIYEVVLGPDHPNTATTLSNLANASVAAGRLDDALGYAERAIAVYEAAFDAAHPNLSTAYYVLGTIQEKRGDYAQSEQTFRRTLETDRGLLGEEHPRVMLDMERITLTLRKQGRLDEAEEMQREVLGRRVSILGAENAATANAHINLSAVLALRDKLEEAEEHARRAIEILEPIEPDTPLMLGAKLQLAQVFSLAAQFDDAEALYREVLARQTARLAADHPDIAATLHGLGAARLRQGRPATAELEEALRIRRAVLGIEHPDTVATLALLDQTR